MHSLVNGDTASIKSKAIARKIEFERELAEITLIQRSPSLFSFSAWTFLLTVSFPFIMSFFHIQPIIYSPLLLMFLTYHQKNHEREEKQAALGVVSSAEIFKFLVTHVSKLPTWTEGTDTESADWINFVLQKLWPHISLVSGITVAIFFCYYCAMLIIDDQCNFTHRTCF